MVAPAARALAPQVTALPPLAIFHDLRWLYSTPAVLALVLRCCCAALLLARSALNTVAGHGWPGRRYLAPPPPLAALRGALAFTLLAGLLMVPIVTLIFGVAVLPFSWPFLARPCRSCWPDRAAAQPRRG